MQALLRSGACSAAALDWHAAAHARMHAAGEALILPSFRAFQRMRHGPSSAGCALQLEPGRACCELLQTARLSCIPGLQSLFICLALDY